MRIVDTLVNRARVGMRERGFVSGGGINDEFGGGDRGGSSAGDSFNLFRVGRPEILPTERGGQSLVVGGEQRFHVFRHGHRPVSLDDPIFRHELVGNIRPFGSSDGNVFLSGDNRSHGPPGRDRIFDPRGNDLVFNHADDSILNGFVALAGRPGELFADMASGRIGAQAFRVGPAVDADDRILYDPATGIVRYDSDGTGPIAAAEFLRVTPGAGVTADNFIVTGSNSNAAPVVSSSGSVSVAENGDVRVAVYNVTASDSDGDRINYSLGGTHAARFTIDPVTGAVFFVASPDFEVQSSYDITVNAYDSSGTAGSRALTVFVTDVNEAPPPPPPAISTVPVFTDREANGTIGTAQFIDRTTLLVDANNANLPSSTLPSGSIQGAIGTPTDLDFFSIYLNEGEQLILDIDGSSGGLDALVRYFGPNGAQLGLNDDARAGDTGSDSGLDSFARFRAPTSGTYTFSVESYTPEPGDPTARSQGGYTLNFSIGPPGTAAQIQEEDTQALLTGRNWAPGMIITYGFPDASTDYPDYATDRGDQEQANGFARLTAAQIGATDEIIRRVQTFSNIDIRQQIGADGDATLRYGRTNTGETAHTYLPPVGGIGGTPRAGDLWFRNGTFDSPVVGNYAWVTIAHETGHALGLGHGHEGLSYAHDSMEYSIMSYRSYVGAPVGPDNGYTNETFGFAQSFMMYDIAALQRLYGADFTFNADDSRYSWNPQTGQMTINGAVATTPGANRVFLTVWDGGGNDTYDLSNYTSNTTIDLRAGEFSTTSQVQLANLGNGHYARGNVANALLFNGDQRSLIENAVAGTGDDTLIANQVANRLTGGAGADTFRWMSASDSAVGAADTILDFQSGTDRIDLSRIDADSRTVGDDAFRFIGSSAFTGSAGELRFDAGPGGAHLFGDVNGDGVADFEIVLQNAAPPVATDFFF